MSPAKKDKGKDKSKKGSKDGGAGKIAVIESELDDIESSINSSLRPGGSDRALQSGLQKALTQLDSVEVPADSPQRTEKRQAMKRVEKLQSRAERAVKPEPEEESDEGEEAPRSPAVKPVRRAKAKAPANETQEEKIARIVEERVMDALDGRDAHIDMLKTQIKYLKKNGNKMMERKAQLKHMGGAGSRFTNMSQDGAIPVDGY